MANMAKIEDKLKILPALPGCYLMKNKDGDIIYVGKAKKLKNRIIELDVENRKLRKQLADMERKMKQ